MQSTFHKLVALTPAERRFLAGAWVLAPVVELSLAAVGLQRTLDGIERLTRGEGRGSGVGVGRGEELIAAAYGRHLVRGRCLPRALLQYALHRRLGDHVRLVIGVRPPGQDDLDAHAWVEDPAGGHRSREDGFEALLERESRAASKAA